MCPIAETVTNGNYATRAMYLYLNFFLVKHTAWLMCRFCYLHEQSNDVWFHSVPELKKNYSNNEDPWADMLWCTICSKAEFTLKAETLIYTKGMIIKFQTCQRVIFSVYESVYFFPHSVVPTFASIPCPKCCRRGRIENGQRPSWSLPMAHRVCVYVNVYTARFLTDSYLYINRTQ